MKIQIISGHAPTGSYKKDDFLDVEFIISCKIKRELFDIYSCKMINDDLTLEELNTILTAPGYGYPA